MITCIISNNYVVNTLQNKKIKLFVVLLYITYMALLVGHDPTTAQP